MVGISRAITRRPPFVQLFRVTICLIMLLILYLLTYHQGSDTASFQPSVPSEAGDIHAAKRLSISQTNTSKLMKQPGKTHAASRLEDFAPKPQVLSNSSTVVNLNVQTISSLQPMAMAVDYWEQVGNAMNNLIDLQCWAETVGITKVMEPEVLTSGGAFGFNCKSIFKSSLAFRDLFDIDAWNSMSVNNSFSPLVSRQSFIDKAVKEMVYVQLIEVQHGGHCISMNKILNQKWYEALNSKGFHIVDKVCIDFRKEPNNNTMTQEEFLERIFGKVGNKVSVVFSTWHGIRDYNDITVRSECSFRNSITGTRCSGVMFKMGSVEFVSSKPSSVKYAHINHPSPLIPSKRVSSYVKQFKVDFMSGTDYIAVMLRTERFKTNLLSASHPNGVNPCMTNIISDWKRMTSELTNSTTLFFSDIGGGHGSSTWGNNAARLLSNKIQDSLHVEHALRDVNRYLEKITGSQNSVLIAAIHREIIAQAKCAIVVGGGKFQKHTLNMFAHYHRGVGELCYSFRNSSCVPNYIDFVYDNLYYRG